MFKDLLIKWVTDLIDKFAAVGQNSYLSIGLSAFNNTLYGWVHTIMTSVVMPIAYVILALFFVLELYKASIKVDGAGGGSSFGAEIVFRVMFKMVLCKVAVDSSLLFMQAIYSVAQAVVTGIAGVVANGSVSGAVDLAAMTAQINAMSLGDQIGSISVYTNADLILAYLDSRYEDYAFSGVIAGLFGTTVKGELETIHAQLHQVEKIRWTEEIEHESTSTDPVTGETTTDTWTEYVYHMDIYLTTKTWEDYYETNKDTLLEPDQQQQYDALQEVGVYTFRQQLSSPFIGVDWSVGVSSRWGWRIHPISGELKQHLGLDIAMPGGTPINACNAGTIVTGSDASGWGNYIKVVAADGSYTLYGHMSGFAVANGQTVNPGDVIGYVGTTGASTGNHLHLEYHDKDNRNLNPLIFTECEKPTP